jgi:transposase
MKRQKHSADFKAKVSLEAIRESRTTAELAGAFEVHGTMITRWKRHVLENPASLFSEKTKQKNRDNEELIAALYQRIGQLTVELDWLKKNRPSSSRGVPITGRSASSSDFGHSSMRSVRAWPVQLLLPTRQGKAPEP